MQKILLSLFCLVFAGVGFAEKLPDNMYFKAMKREMDRSLKKLRRKGAPNPFFIAYKLENLQLAPMIKASFGELHPPFKRDDNLSGYVAISIGSAQKDSWGFKHSAYSDRYSYAPEYSYNIAKSYDGIRQKMWNLTDFGYLFSTELYQQKQAYERTKQQTEDKKLPDVVLTKQAHYVEELAALPSYDEQTLKTKVKELSALGKKYPFLEQFSIQVEPQKRDIFYLNSLGGFYQLSTPTVRIYFSAQLRNRDGFKQNYQSEYWTPSLSEETYTQMQQRVNEFLAGLEALYQAVKPEEYMGPVLLRPHAAGQFIYNLLGKNIQNQKPILSSRSEEDPTVGKFRKVGLRVMAPSITVYDNPLARYVPSPYGEIELGGFMPVDDEGVAAEKLTLVENGRLKQLPRTMRPLKEKTSSNGHARMNQRSFAREGLTNIQVQPQHTLSDAQLEQKLRERCRELGLAYGYILHDFPEENDGVVSRATRIYADTDKRETVYGLRVSNLTTRALRDITAAGEQSQVVWIDSPFVFQGLPSQSVFSPALLVDEMEFVPTDKKPDKKPFVPKP